MKENIREVKFNDLPQAIHLEVMEKFIRSYEFIKGAILEPEEVREGLNSWPLTVSDIYTEAHGHQVMLEWQEVYWDTYDPSFFYSNEQEEDYVYICNECHECHEDYTRNCEECGEPCREVHKDDVGIS